MSELEALLSKTTTEQVAEAESQLSELRENPEFFGQLLSVISSNSSQIIKSAAAIQAKMMLVAHNELSASFPIEDFCSLFDSSTLEFQGILEIICDILCKIHIRENSEEFLAFVAAAVPNGSPSAFYILNSITFDENEHSFYAQILPIEVSCMEFFNSTIEEHINEQVYQSTLHNFLKSLQQTLVFLDEMEGDLIQNVLQMCFTFLQHVIQLQQTNLTHLILESLSNCIYLVINYVKNDEIENVEEFSSIPQSLVEMLESLPDNAKAEVYNVLGNFFENDQLYAIVEPNVDELLLNVFLPVFVHEPESVFALDPQDAIDILFPQDEEEGITPVSAVTKLLRSNAKKLSSNALAIASQIDFENESVVYAYMFLLGCVAAEFSESEVEELTPIIETATQLLEGDEYNICSACAFFYGLPAIEGSQELCKAIIQLFVGAENDIVKYLALAAASNLLRISSDAKEEVTEFIGEGLNDMIQAVFEMNQKYQTEYMAKAVVEFTAFFSESFASFAVEYVSDVISLFSQFMENESSEARMNVGQFIQAIESVFSGLKDNAEVAASIVEQLMTYIKESLEGEFESTFSEELISLMRVCLSYAPEMTPTLAEIPSLISSFIEDDDCLIEDAAPLIRVLAIRFPQAFEEEAITTPIGEIISNILADDDLADNFWEALVVVFQAVFVICGGSEFAQQLSAQVLEMLAETEISTFNIAASLISCNPIAATANENVFASWMENTTPAAFLHSAAAVLSNWENLEEGVKGQIEAIKAKIAESLSELQGATPEQRDPLTPAEPDEDDFTIFNRDELLANPIFKQ